MSRISQPADHEVLPASKICLIALLEAFQILEKIVAQKSLKMRLHDHRFLLKVMVIGVKTFPLAVHFTIATFDLCSCEKTIYE